MLSTIRFSFSPSPSVSTPVTTLLRKNSRISPTVANALRSVRLDTPIESPV